MSTILLIHGTWLGGWVWDRVVPLLRESGHTIIAPDLPGLAGDSAAASAGIDPSVHAAAIVDLLERSDLQDVVLVGHSYGGIVAREAATSTRVGRIIYLDAFLPEAGESAFDLIPWLADAFVPVDDERPWLIAPLPPQALGIEDVDDVAWLAANMTPMPLATHSTAAAAVARVVPSTYVWCEVQPLMVEMAERARARGYDVVGIPTAHLPMVTHPELLAAAVDAAAKGRNR